MDPQNLTRALKAEAYRLGFSLVGATPAQTPPDYEHLLRWLECGFAGAMDGFQRRREAYRDLNRVLEGVKSVLMLALNYRTVEPTAAGPGQGRIARYAWGADYHVVIRQRLRRLERFHLQYTPGAGVRGVVDTAPFLERSFARRAGLGGIGKNTALIHPDYGSWLLLSALLTTEELVDDPPLERDLCGTCRQCLDACPTGALTAPYQLDARRCISYLTIEHCGAIPEELHPAMGDRLFGCDVCQEVCPWNRQGPISSVTELFPRPGMNPVPLDDLFSLNEEQFRRRFSDTPLRRARLEGLLRNATVVHENQNPPRGEKTPG